MAKDKRTKEQKAADKNYSDTMSQYWNKRKKDTDYSSLYEDFHNRTSGGKTLSSDKALNAWENMMLSDQGYKNWSLKKEALDWAKGDEEKASRYLNARPFGYLDEEKWPTEKLQEMLYDAREGRPGEYGKDSKQWPNWTQAIQDALYLRGASEEYTPSGTNNKGQGLQLKEDGTQPPKDRSKLKFDDIVEEVIPGADPDNLSEEQKDLVADAIEKEKGYTPGNRTKEILGDERIAKIENARGSEKNTGDVIPNNPQNPERSYNGLKEIDQDITDLEGNLADPHAAYTGNPVMNPDNTTNGYRNIGSDIKDILYADDRVKEARMNDATRVEAESNKKKLNRLLEAEKTYEQTLDKLNKDLVKENSKTRKAIIKSAISQVSKRAKDIDDQIAAIKGDIKAENERELMNALSEDQRIKLAELNVEKTQLDRHLGYLMNDLQGDIDIFLDPNADTTVKQQSIAKLQEYIPEIQDNLKNRLNIASGELSNIAETVNSTGNKDFIEALNNINAAIEMFNQQGLNIQDPKTAKQLGAFVDRLDDIIKHQDKYDLDTRYANDMKSSAVNRLLFDIFDEVKTAFVFIAAIESGNPQLIRSSIDVYNNKIQQAEADYKVGQIKGLEENKVRELTGQSIADFFTTSQAKPQLDMLREQLHIQTAEQEQELMKGLEKSFEEFNRYKNANPGKATDFSAWVLDRSNKGNPLSMLISASLQNPDAVKSILQGLYSAFTNMGKTNSDRNEKTDIISLGSKGKSDKWIDNALSKANAKKAEKTEEAENNEEETPQLDPALMLDMQNTVSQALASRAAPPQAGAPQAGTPKTNNGFGRTNLA